MLDPEVVFAKYLKLMTYEVEAEWEWHAPITVYEKEFNGTILESSSFNEAAG